MDRPVETTLPFRIFSLYLLLLLLLLLLRLAKDIHYLKYLHISLLISYFIPTSVYVYRNWKDPSCQSLSRRGWRSLLCGKR